MLGPLHWIGLDAVRAEIDVVERLSSERILTTRAFGTNRRLPLVVEFVSGSIGISLRANVRWHVGIKQRHLQLGLICSWSHEFSLILGIILGAHRTRARVRMLCHRTLY